MKAVKEKPIHNIMYCDKKIRAIKEKFKKKNHLIGKFAIGDASLDGQER